MKYKIPKKLLIVGQEYIIKKDKNSNGASFSMSNKEIILGIAQIKTRPERVFEALVHEISEIIHSSLDTRYEAWGNVADYKFVLDHKEFQNHNQILTILLYKYVLK
jgi:hypothetical protein